MFPPSSGFLVQVNYSRESDSGISKIVAPWAGLPGGGTARVGLDHVVGSYFELETLLGVTPEWFLPWVVVVSLETAILVAFGKDGFQLQWGNVLFCDSRWSENRKGNYPIHVVCADHSRGCALDLVEWQSRK